jgi:Protein of unknown function (DUF2569)
MSLRKKQLYVLLAVASWITLVIVWALLPIHYQEGESYTFPAIPAGYVSLDVEWIKSNLPVYSLPAILFGGVLFWWFGKLKCNYCGAINPNLAKSCHACGQTVGAIRAHSDSRKSSASTLSVPLSDVPVSGSAVGFEIEDHAKTYAAMGDDELLQAADLTLAESARKVLNLELRKRHLMNQSRTESTCYKGVEGWLALLIFVLIFATPVSLLVQIIGTLQNAKRPKFDLETVVREAQKQPPQPPAPGTEAAPEQPAFIRGAVGLALIGTGLACFSVYAGILLWRVVPNAVTVAKRFLMTVLVVELLVSAIAASVALSYREWGELLADAVGSALGPLVYVWIWYSYLSRSKRVAATYGACEQISSRPRAVT